MQIVDELTGNIIIRQGDDGQYVVKDIPTDKNYLASFAVYTEDRKKINEMQTQTDNKDFVEFTFPPSFTDEWVVKKGEEEATYYFGIKLSYGLDEIEDTIVIGNKTIYDRNTITVLPKLVEGGV